MSGLLESISTLLSPIGTNVGLKNLFERCLAARTKSEERWLVQDCLKLVKTKLSEATLRTSVVSKCLLFASFAEMLGYKADFAYIHAVKLAQYGSLNEKKIGYLACAVLIRESDPLVVLLVNTILRDLASRNIVVVAMALTACCHLFPVEQLPILLPLLVEKLRHPTEYVRSKAVIVLHKFYRLCPDQCERCIDDVRVLLGDKDPGVVAFVLQFLVDVFQNSLHTANDTAPALVNIQRQILDRKMPKDYIYHGVHAPWIQISLLRLLRLSKEYNSDIQLLLNDTLNMARAGEISGTMQDAIVCECVRTLIALDASGTVQTLAMKHVGELLVSNDTNLRYEGLSLLEDILEKFTITLTPNQQTIVLANLQHDDHTVKRKTLSLLCTVATSVNARIVCTQIADYAQAECADNSCVRKDLINKAVHLISSFPDVQNYWHVAMLMRLLPLTEGEQDADIKCRIKAALMSGPESGNLISARRKVLKILGKYSESKTVSTSILEVYVWVLSNFFALIDETDARNAGLKALNLIVQLGCKVLHNLGSNTDPSSGLLNLLVAIVEAAARVCENSGVSIMALEDFIKELSGVPFYRGYLRECCSELINTLPHLPTVHKVLQASPPLSKDESEKFDFTLTFLDDFVCASLEHGAQPYRPSTCLLLPRQTSTFDLQAGHPETLLNCPSPVSSGRGSISDLHRSVSPCSAEFKSWSLQSYQQVIHPVKPLWTSEGRVKVSDEIPSVETVPSTHDGAPSNIQQVAARLFEDATQTVPLQVFPDGETLEEMLDDDFDKLDIMLTSEKR